MSTIDVIDDIDVAPATVSHGRLGRLLGGLTWPSFHGRVSAASAHEFSFEGIDGGEIALGDYAGRAVLIVNTASRCAFTFQYEALQKLHETYGERGLTVLAVPSNDFGGQEPGDEAEIVCFCAKKFHTSFPFTRKYAVTGALAHPFFTWAADQFGPSGRPRWNFHKYLISGDGQIIGSFSSVVGPTSVKVTNAIEAALPRPS